MIENLIETNKKLIYSIAHNVANKYGKISIIEDLFQVGVISIIKAYDNYKETENTKFSTYAYMYILGSMLEYVNKDRNVKVSVDTLKLYNSYNKSKEFLTNKLNRIPTISEVSDFMGVDINTLMFTIQSVEYTLSLENKKDEEDLSIEERVGIDRSEIIDNLLDLKEELLRLPENERKLIELRYFQDLTQSETARYLNMTQVQVSRSETQILKKIKTGITA